MSAFPQHCLEKKFCTEPFARLVSVVSLSGVVALKCQCVFLTWDSLNHNFQ